MNQHALFAAEETHRIQIAATCGHIVFMDFSVRMAVKEIGERVQRMESQSCAVCQQSNVGKRDPNAHIGATQE